MVNSNVIRATGLVVLAGTYVMYDRVYSSSVINGARAKNTFLVGGNRGSLYNTCSEGSETLAKLTSVNLAKKSVTNLSYNFYNIDNPKDYLTGGDAIVVEQGPYKLQRHTVAYDVAQSPSPLTDASDPDPRGSLKYSTANAYLVLDRDVTATSNLKRNADLSLTTSSDSKVTLPTAKKALASHLSMSDRVTNFSPDYISFLGAMNDEVNMILSVHCTSGQIANIGDSGKAQCTGNEFGDISVNCACCTLDDDYQLESSRNNGSPPAFINCNSYFDDEGPVLSLLSLLASHDGGVSIKAAGEKKYDGSGDNFASTLFGQTEIHTALIQSHTVNDLMFGYPSAYLGRVAYLAQRSQAQDASPASYTKADVSKLMLTGAMDGELSFKLGDIASYTSSVGKVCYSTCTDAGGCSGRAPERNEFIDVDKIKLGGIDCKPYTSTFETVAKCKAINAVLTLDPNADGFEACTCANESDEWSTQGCCLAAGMNPDEDLAGAGCLFEVAGIVDPNYTGMDSSIANAVDLGAAVQSWINKQESKISSTFMCPAEGSGIAEHAKFGHYESFDGSDLHVTYYHTGNDRMRQGDVSSTDSTAYLSKVSGSSGKYFKPKGLYTKVGTSQVTDGIPVGPHPVYIPDAKKPIDFVFEGFRPGFVRNKVCGTDTCVVSARMRPNTTVFDFDEAKLDGTGMPYDGLQPVGHIKGPSVTGRPEYVHHPLYYNGDEALYTQQDNSHVEKANGNGLRIYRPNIDTDPGDFDVSSSKYQLVDKTYVDTQTDVLHSHIDIEVATGLGARERMRFGTSYSVWECDPSTNEKCKRGLKSKGEYSCYKGTVGPAIFGALANTDKGDLTTLGRNKPTYPCSAANFLTPELVGGKILPMFWSEESTVHMKTDEIDKVAKHANEYMLEGDNFILIVCIAYFLVFLGFSMLLLCLCFEQKHDFFKAEVPKGLAPAFTGKSVAAA
ncbi:hypothetical protein HJC23_008319 [Cyclotella cryptica]|uniref:Uncharacterized protein n=1 Tax=Cyclotella cryptica TaxID=29204 RepID=A0ABD3Q437_9STRA